MENLLKQIEELRERVLKACQHLDIDGQACLLANLKAEINKSDFWQDQQKAIEISRKAEELNSEIEKWRSLNQRIRDLEELVALGSHENDLSIEDGAHKNYKELLAEFEKMEFMFLFSGKYDAENAILSIHAGTGGVDAQDWAQMLERMYLRFAERKNFKLEILDRLVGNEAGIKNTTIKISGRWAYGYLRSESGVHRLVRISPFDSDKARHTSFALVDVLPEIPDSVDLEIKENDLRIDVFRSSGAGGQSVNTTDSAVRIVHLPTNIIVTCQNERSQFQNKENALKILKAKLIKLEEEKKEEEEKKLRGEVQKAEWGKQIRSYVLQPYQMVKDHRTQYETSNINDVLDGDLEGFMEEFLSITNYKLRIKNDEKK